MAVYSFPSLQTGGKTLILGLGETGVAAALWCARAGVSLVVVDTRDQPPGLDTLKASLADSAAKVNYRLGEADLEHIDLEGVDRLVISPGLSPYQSPVSELLARARQKGIAVVNEVELFALALKDMAEQGYTPRVLAVTGTNGKTTVTALTRHLVAASGLTVQAAGNISPAALAALAQAVDDDQLPQVWVLELSSFQLETVYSLAPDAGAVLNLTQDHLDWHGSMQAYGQAKARLLQLSRIAVINRDDPLVLSMVNDAVAPDVRSFGRNSPRWQGDLGIDTEQGVQWLLACEVDDFDVPSVPRRRKGDTAPPSRKAGRVQRLMPVDALRIRGLHNALNALAALALSRSLDLNWAALLHALRDYAGEPNRTEFVRNIGGVDFINDSKGTNVGATVAALEGLGQRVVLIAGGQGKGQDFSPLQPVVAAHAQAVVLIGVDAPRIEAALASTGVEMVHAANMDDAVQQAMQRAQPGQAVLLSPACASLDMYRNYVQRARAFVDAVNALALDHGEVA